MSLAHHQNWFWTSVTRSKPSDDAIASRVQGGKVSATVRLQVYRSMYRQRLGKTLEKTHERTQTFLGHDDFVRLGWKYLAANPSPRPTIETVGLDLGKFLRDKGYPVAADIADIESARLSALLAPADPIVEELSPEQVLEGSISLNRSVALLTVSSSGLNAWQPAGSEPDRNPSQSSPKTAHLCIFRRSHHVQQHRVDHAEHAALQAVRQGEQLVDALGHFQFDSDPSQAAFGALSRWLRWGIVSGVNVRDPELRREAL